MNLSVWTKRFFDENSNIEWNCPNCKSNSLKLIKEKLFFEETIQSSNFRKNNDEWEIEWIEYIVNGSLNCKNCNENIFFIGKGNPEHSGYYDYELDEYMEKYTDTFTPTYFQPVIHIFEIPENCPELVKIEIVNSFKLFWSDLHSCANKIRTSIEILLNELKIKRFEIKKGKQHPISLHKRILSFKNKEVKDYLIAIKWIGNIGTHKTDKIETIDILEIYKLLEFSLMKLYDDKEKEIKKIAQGINKRKGTRKRKNNA